MSHHIFGYPHILVGLAVVYLENQANKVGENGRSSRLCLDRRHTLARLWPNYRQTVGVLLIKTALVKGNEDLVNIRDNVRA